MVCDDGQNISLKGLNNNNRGQRPRFITNPKIVLARIFVRYDKNRDKTEIKNEWLILPPLPRVTPNQTPNRHNHNIPRIKKL